MVLMTSRPKSFRKNLPRLLRMVAILALGNACLRTLTLVALAGSGPSTPAVGLSGTEALAFTRRGGSFGPRPSGSPGIKKLQAYILGELKASGCQGMQDDFTASTPPGP